MDFTTKVQPNSHILGKGEEVYLDALFARVRAFESPADRAAKNFIKGGLPFMLRHLVLKKKHIKTAR